MKNKFNEEILNGKNSVIAALHLMPLIGYEGYSSYEEIEKKAIKDLTCFCVGGVDAIIIENNYDLPHRIKETTAATKMMERLVMSLSGYANIPLGICVLWNDFDAAFRIAKKVNAKFIRVPVFVDSVDTDFGRIIACPKEVIASRSRHNAEDVSILADIHVKHAIMLDKDKTIAESAIDAIKEGADAIIITGKWTGLPPSIEELKNARDVLGKDFPVFVGSGASVENIKRLQEFATGAIVSTSLKKGLNYSMQEERNIKPYSSDIDIDKVKRFVDVAKRR